LFLAMDTRDLGSSGRLAAMTNVERGPSIPPGDAHMIRS
jgi:hypothetical protein